MGLDFVRFAKDDINAAAIGFPAGHTRGKVLVGVRDTPVMLFFERVVSVARIRIPALPELINE